MNPQPSQGPPEVAETPLPKPNRRKLILLLAAIIFATAVVALLAYFLLRNTSSQPASTPNPPLQPAVSLKPPKIQLNPLGFSVSQPTAIVSASQNDKRIFILDQDGRIFSTGSDQKLLSTPFLDIRNLVYSNGEMGLLGLAFSPGFRQNGYFFINYIDKNQNTVVARYKVSADTNLADPNSGQTLLSLKQPYPNHNGGQLAFGPDGYLYIGLGDGGSAGDPQNRAQNLGTLFGKILRIDVSQIPYKIPTSNPYANQAGKSPEIWDYGLRNPWRFSFDRQNKELYIADVGQNKAEEIDVEASDHGGNNYGWRCYEADLGYNLDGCGPRSQYIFPVITYDHSQNRCSITGGYVYRGSKFPALKGKYFYGDYCGGQLYFAQKNSGKWLVHTGLATNYQISTFGEDSQGELYLADYKTGNIYQIQDIAN